jgi:hypothetical protein
MTERSSTIIGQIRADLAEAEANEDYGDGDLGRNVTVGDLNRMVMASDWLRVLLDVAEAAQSVEVAWGDYVADEAKEHHDLSMAMARLSNALTGVIPQEGPG